MFAFSDRVNPADSGDPRDLQHLFLALLHSNNCLLLSFVLHVFFSSLSTSFVMKC